MIVEIKELCEVDYIHANEPETGEILHAVRTVHYESNKNTLLEALKEYDGDEFDSNNVIRCNDEFEGECLSTIKILSVTL